MVHVIRRVRVCVRVCVCFTYTNGRQDDDPWGRLGHRPGERREPYKFDPVDGSSGNYC